jgi:hypothetical protein
MGLLGSFKKFFTPKQEAPKQPEPQSVENLIGVRFGAPQAKPVVTIQNMATPPVETNKIIEKPVYNNINQGDFMGEKYLVVLDTTNRPEVKDRGLQGGLKNFYFVCATTPDQAREYVLRTFARSPQILQQVQYSLTVTPLSRIAPHINEQNPFWSYIPFNKGQRAPGQRSAPPTQNVNPNNPEEVIPMNPRDIPAPLTPITQDDTPKISEIDKEAQARAANPMAGFSPTLPNGQPNPMFAMMQMMMAAMQAGQAPVAAPVPPQAVVTRGNPNDPELQARMAEVRSTAVAQHRNHDPTALDEGMEAAEQRATQQVERFKTLPREQQSAAGLQRVDMNDVGVDMDKMTNIMRASTIPQSS